MPLPEGYRPHELRYLAACHVCKAVCPILTREVRFTVSTDRFGSSRKTRFYSAVDPPAAWQVRDYGDSGRMHGFLEVGCCGKCGATKQKNGGTAVTATVMTIKISAHKCDPRCQYAKGHKCECSCGGKNHAQGHIEVTAHNASLFSETT